MDGGLKYKTINDVVASYLLVNYEFDRAAKRNAAALENLTL
jgi:hypothetical protein